MQPEQINSCEEFLAAWDSGENIFTIEMGGLGPGYEQCIHITAFEILRYMLANPPDWERIDADAGQTDIPYGMRYWDKYKEEMDTVLFAEGAPCKELGLSGAQYGAACNIASMFMRHGYQGGLSKAPKDRRIQVTKHFPIIKAAEIMKAGD